MKIISKVNELDVRLETIERILMIYNKYPEKAEAEPEPTKQQKVVVKTTTIQLSLLRDGGWMMRLEGGREFGYSKNATLDSVKAVMLQMEEEFGVIS